jgi:hypothetical protein
MKYLLIVAVSFLTNFALAGGDSSVADTKSKMFSRPYGLAGCGLGSVIVGKKGSQIFAATTNGTSYNQSLGITFGTLNCVDAPEDKVAHSLDLFILNNRAQVEVNMVQGSGEAILTLFQIMGCQGNPDKLGKLLKSKYSNIFPSPDVPSNEVTDKIIESVLNDEELSSTCQLS